MSFWSQKKKKEALAFMMGDPIEGEITIISTLADFERAYMKDRRLMK